MSSEELNKKTEQMSLGGGGGPQQQFSFKKMNTKAAAFVPSWLPPPASTTPSQTTSLPVQESPKPAKKKEKTVEKVVEKPAEKPIEKTVSMPDVVDEEIDLTGVQENMNVLFMGHVDAGKSTLGGHLLLLTGMVDKRTVEQYKEKAKELGRESWYLSWALDLNQEERDKGKTTEYGRGTFVTEKRRYTIIDAPGHRSFVPSMIEGAAQADVGVLVISARKGEFETGFEKDGQTREHVLLAKTAGVKKILMVINKMDEPTVQWSKERYDEIVGKMVPFMKAAGFGKNDLEILPISGFSGANMKDPVDPSVCDWYSGPPLLTLLDSIAIERTNTGPFMMPIADKVKDMGTVAMGKIESGAVKKGSTLMIMPNKKFTEVLGIMIDENEVQVAHHGDNVRLRLKNVDEEDLLPGFVLCSIKNPVHAVTQFEAQLQVVDYPSIMCAGYMAVMHCHTTREEITIAELLHKVDKKTKKKSKKAPQFMKQGDVCIVRIEATRLVCCETFEEYPQLGRFTIRDEAKTVCIGKITKLIESA